GPNGPLVVLCVNVGSSSLKTALFEVDGAAERVLARAAYPVESDDYTAALDAALVSFDAQGLPLPGAAGHRVVHGGPRHAEPVLVDHDVLTDLRELVPFAPLHMPAAIAGIDAIRDRWDIPQVACFDTAFHRHMPEVAQRLPLPDALWDAGVRRYGFHGLSYEYIAGALGAAQLGRAVIAHLGYRARKYVGALAAVLGGLDTIVFTGGVGEKAAAVRAGICDGLEHLGVELDDDANAAGAAVISAPGGGCVVRVERTDEDLVIARHTGALVAR